MDVEIQYDKIYSAMAKKGMINLRENSALKFKSFDSPNRNHEIMNFEKHAYIDKPEFDTFFRIHLGKTYAFEIKFLYHLEFLAEEFQNKKLFDEIQSIKPTLPTPLLSICQYLYDKNDSALKIVTDCFSNPSILQYPELFEIDPQAILTNILKAKYISPEVKETLLKYLAIKKLPPQEELVAKLDIDSLTDDQRRIIFHDDVKPTGSTINNLREDYTKNEGNIREFQKMYDEFKSHLESVKQEMAKSLSDLRAQDRKVQFNHIQEQFAKIQTKYQLFHSSIETMESDFESLKNQLNRLTELNRNHDQSA